MPPLLADRLTLWRRRGLLAQAALAILALVFTLNTARVLQLPLPAAPHETLVIGQEQLVPGSQAALRVIVRSPGNATTAAEPVEGADVTVRIGRTAGLAKTVYTGQTDASGTANVAFTVPEDLGHTNLVVETSSATGHGQIVRPITIARDYKLFLSSDKPAYRPGQTIHLRALALDAVSLKPDVFVVTGDHSTPATMASHSWHPVPVLLNAATCRTDDTSHFHETACAHGGLGRMPMVELLPLILAHAGRLNKFGA